jgi:hypothetical protein
MSYAFCSFAAMLAMAQNRYAVVLPAFQQRAVNSSSGLLDSKPILFETIQRQAAEALTAGCKACEGAANASKWLATPSESALYAVNYTAGCAHSCS